MATLGNRRIDALVALLAGAGVMHFVVPGPYKRIVPPKLGDPTMLVKASGVAELACAALVAAPATRKIGGLASAALFVGVFPANVYAIKVVGDNKIARAAMIARLPLQIPLIMAALKVSKAAD